MAIRAPQGRTEMMNRRTNTMTDLTGIFTDPNFELFERNCYFNEAAKIGVVVASRNSNYPDFALNEPAFTRLLAALENGRANEAWVVFARDDDGYKRTFRGAKPATELRDQIKAIGLEPRESKKFGDFYVLPRTLGPDDGDAPF
jgi:hypothetical protein